MAESITEGTLKQWSKQIGDHVEQDEEIATIETDKIDVAVNAPQAGTIKEFLANEEDTVTVGQDLVKLELGGASEGGGKQQASQEPKAAAPDEQPTSSDPEPTQNETQSEESSKPQPPPEKPKQEQQPPQKSEPSPQEKGPPKQDNPAPKPSESKKPALKPSDSQGEGSPAAQGGRGERRVNWELLT
ncbi:MAG: hypothetical protein Q9166_000841 [cf. Caloplaca sp. 2 TL-2023]